MDYNKPDALDRADNMLIKCGKFASIVQIICSVICIIFFCGFGIILFTKKNKRIKTNAIILDSKCNTYPIKKKYTKMKTDCMLDIEYKIGEEMKQAKITTSDKIHSKGKNIEIYYDPANPEDVIYKSFTNKNGSLVLIGIGSCIVVLMIIHIILMKKSDWYKRLLCLNLIGDVLD